MRARTGLTFSTAWPPHGVRLWMAGDSGKEDDMGVRNTGGRSGEWPYHENNHGEWVRCESNPCSRHSGGDIMATSPEDAYGKADRMLREQGHAPGLHEGPVTPKPGFAPVGESVADRLRRLSAGTPEVGSRTRGPASGA